MTRHDRYQCKKNNFFDSRNLSLVCAVIGLMLTVGCSNPMFKGFRKANGETGTAESNAATAASPGEIAKGHSESGWLDNFEQAKEVSRQTGKPILADFTGSDWCHWCKRLSADVFSKSEFEEWANENVVLLELDYPKYGAQSRLIREQNEMLKKKFNIQSYPTVLLLDAEENVLGKLGYKDSPEGFIRTASTQLSGGLFGGNGLKLR